MNLDIKLEIAFWASLTQTTVWAASNAKDSAVWELLWLAAASGVLLLQRRLK